MEPKRILVRVDGGAQIGMGHVMRCLTLVKLLKEKAPVEARFATRAGTEAAAWIRGQGYAVDEMPAQTDNSAEIAWTAGLVRAQKPDAVITDLREFIPGVLEAIREAGAPCVTIDEWGGKRVPSEILTNGTVVPAWHRYQLEGEVRCLVGAEYALLDPQFEAAHAAPRPPAREELRLLVALGGDDPFFLTRKTLRVMEKIEKKLRVTVVIGPAFLDGAEIRAACCPSRHRIEVLENISNMAELMAESDAAVVAGGLIALEAACTGTPALILCEVDHQLDTASALEERGAAVNLGLGERLAEEKFAEILRGLLEDPGRRAQMSMAGKKLVDGRGCARVADAVLNLLAEKEDACAPA